MIRKIALLVRERSNIRQEFKVLRQFEEWRTLFDQFPASAKAENKLAIIRVDDIGDYLLFRNFLTFYKNSTRFKNYSITLIGNIVWKSIFEEFDTASVDQTIWVDKHQYFSNKNYRTDLWKNINVQNFTTVVCPSRTRPLLLDDMMALATKATYKIACSNSHTVEECNNASDNLYDELFPSNFLEHEYHFNRAFTEKINKIVLPIASPSLPFTLNAIIPDKTVICFIGASAKSKTWPVNYWIVLIKTLLKNDLNPLLVGGKNELEMANKIIDQTGVSSIVGQTNLIQTLNTIANAMAVVTGDTMAVHAAAAYSKPTVIIANGINAKRFVAYQEAGFNFIRTVYSKPYLKTASKNETRYRAVTKDMQSIKPTVVFESLQEVLNLALLPKNKKRVA
ncbi:MAG TPA: glycosyltransferase family 9 protein [Cytophagaceae bacterium]|nr:glycosyltransferase family 9 protein [Cytophagaceae bacterium]